MNKLFKASSILIISLLLNLSLLAQENFCEIEATPPQLNTNNTTFSCAVPSENYIPDLDHLDHTPITTIYVNFHFVRDLQCGYNFGPDDDGLGNPNVTGAGVANGFLQGLNNRASNLAANALPNANGEFAIHIPDTRIRFELYSENTNPNDTYGGIWYPCSDLFDNFGTFVSTFTNAFSQYGDKL